MMGLIWLICIVGGYVIGSIPFGVLIARSQGVDIRQHGSKNIGATNVWRVLGRRLGVLCFALDCLKGAAPVLIAGLMTGVLGESSAQLTQTEMILWLAVAASAVMGHMFSIFLGFAGGKGVATGFGAIAAMYPLLTWAALLAIAVWYVTLRFSRYVSLASIVAACSLPVALVVTVLLVDESPPPEASVWERIADVWPPLAGTGAIALLVVYRHRANIGRIRRGEEPKVRFGRRGDGPTQSAQ